jgi:Zn-dependent metalloprotease
LAAGALPALASASKSEPVIARTQPARVAEAQAHLACSLAPLGLGSDHEGVLLRAVTDATGGTTARFQQQYRGVPVWGAQWVTNQNAQGQFQGDRNSFQRVREMSVTPSLPESEALAVAQQAMKAKGAYAVMPQAELVLVPIEQRVIAAKTHADGSLNARDVRRAITGHLLAYHVSLMVENEQDGIAQKDYLIHAHSGEVIRQWDSLESDQAAVGQGNSQYSGMVALNTVKKTDGTYTLVDTTRGSLPHPITGNTGNATYNLNNVYPNDAAGYSSGAAYIDADDTWGDGKQYIMGVKHHTTDANGQTEAVDAHFGLANTWDMYKNVFKRNGIDDLGTSTFARVHYGQQFGNAYWNTGCFCMTYGDGTLPNPMFHSPGMNAITEIDITGHEMSHGVTAYSAALQYYGESGGLNEASSDMMGKMVEFYTKNGATGSTIPDTGAGWTLGWGVWTGGGAPLRWFYKPSLDGQSPDYWVPTLYNLDVHYSSGAANHMFYFLSVGASADASSQSSSRFLPTGMTGLGNQKASQIWYRALTHYMKPDTQYFDSRRACLQAATDLFGELSPEYKAVQNAYAGINVGIAADGTKEDFTPPVIHGMTVQGSTGTVTFTTQATDDRGVASVDYFVDGFYVGTSTDPGFKLPFDSATLSNDVHTLTALAYDTNQNESAWSAPVTFTVHNATFNGFQNGGFEWQWMGWGSDSSLPDKPWLSGYPHSGTLSMGFGARYSNTLNAYSPFHAALTQDLKLPSDCDTLTLSFWLLASNPDPDTPAPGDGLAHDTLTVRFLDANGKILKTVGSFSNLDDTPDPYNPVWVQKTFDIADLKGQRVRLQVDGVNDDQGFGTVFVIDDFALLGAVKTQVNVADLNGDGVVDGYDLALLMAAFDPTKSPSDPKADLNGDGVVDDKDLDILLANFGK